MGIIIIIFFKKRKLCFKEPRFRWNFLWAEGIASVMWETAEILRKLHTGRVHAIEHKV